MTFAPVIPRTLRRTDPVCASLRLKHSHGTKQVIIEFTFSPQLCAGLNWRAGERIEVAVGEQQDHGRVRLRPHADGYVLKKAGNGNTSTRLKITLNYWGPEGTTRQAACSARPDTIGHTLTIELPWAKRLASVA